MDGYEYLGFEIRPSMLSALQRYAFDGAPVGDFLRCVISNDFMGACGHADSENLRNLPAFSAWLYNEAPALSHGSGERYNAWLNMHEAKRLKVVAKVNGSGSL